MIYLILEIIILVGLITAIAGAILSVMNAAMLMDDSLIFGGRDGSKR